MPFSGFLKPKPSGGRKPMIGKQIITPGSANTPINFGFHDGTGYSSAVVVPVANVLAGTTIAGQTGLIPNQGSPIWTPGTADQVLAAGYYPGGTVKGDANLIPANLLTTVFGVVGTAVSGKRSATGTTASNAVYQTFTYISGGTNTEYTVTVTGLAFKPSIIYLMHNSGTSDDITIYNELSGDLYAKTVKIVNTFGTSISSSAATLHFKGDVSSASVTSGGFVLPVLNPSVSYTWIAIE